MSEIDTQETNSTEQDASNGAPEEERASEASEAAESAGQRMAPPPYKAYAPAPPDGGFEVHLTTGKDLQKCLSRPALIIGILLIAVGALLLFLMLFSAVFNFFVYETLNLDSNWWMFPLGLFAALFGGMTLRNYARSIKDAARRPRQIVYRFYRGFFTVTAIREGEDMGTQKIYYSDLTQTRETKQFFLLYVNSASVYPVEKNSLTPEGSALIRSLLQK